MLQRVEHHGDRYYQLDTAEGRLLLPSVTTVLRHVIRQHHLERWRGQVGNEAADRALQEAVAHGLSVHRAAETEMPPPIATLLNEQGLAVIAQEVTVWSVTHGYAGTADLLCLDPLGNMWVLDIKTSNYVSPTWRLQTAAYAMAAEESLQTGPIPYRGIIHMPRGGQGVYFYDLDGSDGDRAAWLAALELWRWLKALEGGHGMGG